MSDKDKTGPRNAARREMLKRVGVAGAVAVVPATELTCSSQAQPKPASAHGPLCEALETLTAAEADVLEAVVARIVPTDENGPGAAEARAAHYIDRALTGPLASSKAAYVSGLAALDAYAQSSKGALFSKLNARDQDAVLTDFEKMPPNRFWRTQRGFSTWCAITPCRACSAIRITAATPTASAGI